MQGLWEQREKELTTQLGDFEKKLSDYAVAEKAWHEREQELLGHRDKVLSSSAEASSASQQALTNALDEQARLQTQMDAMLDELAKVREELQQTQEAHRTRESQLSEELASLRGELTSHQDGSAKVAVASSEQSSPADHSGAIQAATEKIQAARSQSEILKALLEGAAQFAGRSGILVVHGRTATGWAGRGFGSDAEFRRLSVECASGLAARVVQSRRYTRGQAKEFDAKLVQSFGAPDDGHAHIFPLVVRDRVAAFFYADCGSHVTHDVASDSIDSVVRAAGAWLDDLAGTKGTPKSDVLPSPTASLAQAMASPKPMAAMAAAASAATTAVAPAGENSDAARLRARRFAKLLVDEIKLYNKDAVEQGRRNSDLYDRLRESIDKSRASYDKRWGKTISDVDYFREELVRNLAENDVAILGSNFPR